MPRGMIEILCTGSEPGKRHRDERVPHLVIGDGAPLLLVQQAVLLLQPGDDALDAFVEVLQCHLGGAAARGEQRRLVHQVGELGAGEAGRERGDLLRIDVGGRASPS